MGVKNVRRIAPAGISKCIENTKAFNNIIKHIWRTYNADI